MKEGYIMKVTVHGTGYVGLVTGACLAYMGHEVVCLDTDASKIQCLNDGGVPIYERRLKDVIDSARKKEKLKFSTDIKTSVEHGDIQFIAVGTPDRNGQTNLDYVISAATNIGTYIDRKILVVNKSTVPVGTAKLVKKTIMRKMIQDGKTVPNIPVISNPEFLKEGDAVRDFFKPDRIIIGADIYADFLYIKELYIQHEYIKCDRYIHMDVESAELSKYAANSMLATKISFMNEMSRLCEKVGADIESVREGIGSDSRIGPHFLKAGIGYGGSCFPKDVNSLISMFRENGTHPTIIGAVKGVNDHQKNWAYRKIQELFQSEGVDPQFKSDLTIGIWGLSFKPETDDVRESPALNLIHKILENAENIKIQAYDPIVKSIDSLSLTEQLDVRICESKEEAVLGVDALVICTDWDEFDFEIESLKDFMIEPIIIDGRNMYDPKIMKDMGYEYYSVGR
jgi:UDPglucose 6-dehydrogenase